MAMTSINVRVDEDDKQWFDWFCKELGLTMSTAVQMYIKAAKRENKLPLELGFDPFFSESNMCHLEEGAKAFENGDRGRPLTAEEMEALGLGKDGYSANAQSTRRTNVLDAA
ncbi:MAG: type II toxin-antitoxin system RelB/DinJ family antitoxin [Oscillospiraceae bacterium]|nr:type II toxin-antitoxin system RelB/DinJ family antitoxin [Oscillospiraceae bacterium]